MLPKLYVRLICKELDIEIEEFEVRYLGNWVVHLKDDIETKNCKYMYLGTFVLSLKHNTEIKECKLKNSNFR